MLVQVFFSKGSLDFMKLTKDFDFSSYHAMPYHPKVSSSQLFNWYSFLNDHSDKKYMGLYKWKLGSKD